MDKSINLVAHEWIKGLVNADSIVIDATVGNGKDTSFLSNICHTVYAFDIQPQAIQNSKELNSHANNIIYICDSHEYITKYVCELVDLIVFNLGYLPGGNHEITTTSSSTKKALHESAKVLKDNGSIIITCYTGHPGGFKEYQTVMKEIKNSNYKIIAIYQYQNIENPPILIHISK